MEPVFSVYGFTFLFAILQFARKFPETLEFFSMCILKYSGAPMGQLCEGEAFAGHVKISL